ncbi:MAG: hypothetical protein Q4A29_07515 [Eubacteriales bacterium]|nr:hypothetical protein [Eubacteriales bacterium]
MKKIIALLLFFYLLTGCSSAPQKASMERDTTGFRVMEEESTESVDASRRVASLQPADEQETPYEKTEVGINPSQNAEEYSTQADKYVKLTYYHKNKELIAPYFLFETGDAERVNKEIEELTLSLGDKFSEETPIHTTYTSLSYSGVLSTLIQMNMNGEIDFVVYNFDMESGEQLGIDDVLAVAGLDWQDAKGIFYRDRAAFWKGVEKIRKQGQSTLDSYLNREMDKINNLYNNGKLSIILDEDGLINFVVYLQDEHLDYYWQLYCISKNRTERLQRNAYSREFPMVVIKSPTEEELSNINIIKKIMVDEKQESEKSSFLLLPLWENLNVSWKQWDIKRNGQEEETIWQQKNLYVGEAIYIEIDENGLKEDNFVQIQLGDQKATFVPKEHLEIDSESEGILYLPFAEK